MNEAAFWSGRLRPHLEDACIAARIRYHFERVENTVAMGTPDVDYCISGASGKIELKYMDRHPVRRTTPVLGRGMGMRRSQLIWAHKRMRAGGRVFLGVGTPQETWIIDLRGYTPEDMDAIQFATVPRLREISAWCSYSMDWATLPPTLRR